MHFGRWVRAERLARRLTATECARRTEITLQAWSKMERFTDQPRVETVAKVASALGMSQEAVFRAVMSEDESRDDGCAETDLKEIIRLWERIPPAKRGTLKDMMVLLAS